MLHYLGIVNLSFFIYAFSLILAVFSRIHMGWSFGFELICPCGALTCIIQANRFFWFLFAASSIDLVQNLNQINPVFRFYICEMIKLQLVCKRWWQPPIDCRRLWMLLQHLSDCISFRIYCTNHFHSALLCMYENHILLLYQNQYVL